MSQRGETESNLRPWKPDVRHTPSEGETMPNAQYVNPETLSRSRGYSQVVKVGNTVYIAGQVSAGADGNVVGKGDPEAQVRQVWRNIEAAIKTAGGTLQNVMKTTTYVTNI